MGEQFVGADIAALRQLGATMDTQAETLLAIQAQISANVAAVAWTGIDATGFADTWNFQDSPRLTACVTALTEAAETVRRNADAQDGASAAESGPGRSPLSSSQDQTRGTDRNSSENAKQKYEDEIRQAFDDEQTWKPLPGSEEEVEADEALDSANTAQGALGDCWFVASLTAIADRDPDFIRDHMTRNDNGTWTVDMYHDGELVKITVGPLAPTDGGSNADGKMNYVTIYEAAAVEYMQKYGDGSGSYLDIDGGNAPKAFDMITGQDTRHLSVSNIHFASDGWPNGPMPPPDEFLKEALTKGPVYISSKADPADPGGFLFWENPSVQNSEVVPKHAYILERVEGSGSDCVFVLRNPWGADGGTFRDADDVNHHCPGEIYLSAKELRENFDDMYISQDPR